MIAGQALNQRQQYPSVFQVGKEIFHHPSVTVLQQNKQRTKTKPI